MYGQSPDLENRIHRSAFIGNSAVFEGGAIYYNSVRRGATSCYFLGNDAGTEGGAVYASQCELATRLGNCSFYDNTAASGPAVACDSDLRIDNSIIWNHGASPLALAGGTHDVRYSNIEHGYIGTGNINSNPLFVDPVAADFRLSPGSPCIDAGGNNLLPAYALNDFSGNPRRVDDPNTADTGAGSAPVVDMGAYEFTGPVGPACAADLTGAGGTPDGDVNVSDLFLLLANWNTAGPGADLAPPTNIVDVADLFALLADWGPCD